MLTTYDSRWGDWSRWSWYDLRVCDCKIPMDLSVFSMNSDGAIGQILSPDDVWLTLKISVQIDPQWGETRFQVRTERCPSLINAHMTYEYIYNRGPNIYWYNICQSLHTGKYVITIYYIKYINTLLVINDETSRAQLPSIYIWKCSFPE